MLPNVYALTAIAMDFKDNADPKDVTQTKVEQDGFIFRSCEVSGAHCLSDAAETTALLQKTQISCFI